MTQVRFAAATVGVLSLLAGMVREAPAQTGSALTQTIYPGEDVQARIAAAPRSATFILKSGVHRLQSITPRSGDTFTGEPGTVLSGARLVTTAVRSGSYWVVADATNENPQIGTVAGGECRASAPRCGYPEDLFIDDTPLEHVSRLADVGPGKWYFDYSANQIFLSDDPTGKRLEASVTAKAFGGPAIGVTIRNLVVEKYATPTAEAAINLGTQWIIEDSEVRWNHYGAIATGPQSIARRNRVHHNGGTGFQGAGEGILVAENEISYNGYAGYNPFWGAGGSKWVWTIKLVVRDNFSHHNRGPGLWTDVNNIYTLYENNRVEDNERGGIVHEISYDATIRGNTVRRNGSGRDFPHWTTGAGIEVISSRNVEVDGNTVEDNWQGITALDDHRGSGNNGPWTIVNLNVHHNVIRSRIDDDGAGRIGIIDMKGTAAFLTTSNNRFQQNTYSLGERRLYFLWMGREVDEGEWRRFQQDVAGIFER